MVLGSTEIGKKREKEEKAKKNQANNHTVVINLLLAF